MTPQPDAILWNRRNLIFCVSAGEGKREEIRVERGKSEEWVVKRFSRRFPSQIVYALRSSKARRSFIYAREMTRRGIATPEPVACAEMRGPAHLLLDSIYVSVRSDSLPLADALSMARATGTLPDMLRAFAHFTADMHLAGFIHNDLNLTNVRVTLDDDGPRFSVIDLNRMRIYPKNTIPPLNIRFKDLTRWSSLNDDFTLFAAEYLRHSGLPAGMMTDIVAEKRRHDRRWDRKHRLKRIFTSKKRHHA